MKWYPNEPYRNLHSRSKNIKQMYANLNFLDKPVIPYWIAEEKRKLALLLTIYP